MIINQLRTPFNTRIESIINNNVNLFFLNAKYSLEEEVYNYFLDNKSVIDDGDNDELKNIDIDVIVDRDNPNLEEVFDYRSALNFLSYKLTKMPDTKLFISGKYSFEHKKIIKATKHTFLNNFTTFLFYEVFHIADYDNMSYECYYDIVTENDIDETIIIYFIIKYNLDNRVLFTKQRFVSLVNNSNGPDYEDDLE